MEWLHCICASCKPVQKQKDAVGLDGRGGWRGLTLSRIFQVSVNKPSLLSTILRSSSIVLESKQATELHTIAIFASTNTEGHGLWPPFPNTWATRLCHFH